MTAARAGRGRVGVVVGLGVAVIAALVWLWPDPDADRAGVARKGDGGTTRQAAACSLETFVDQPGPRLSACRPPYGPDSPFNQRLGGTPRLMERSSATVAQLTEGDPPAPIVLGDPVRDGGVPVYRSRMSDPLYTLHCTKPWGRCEIEGSRVRIPAAARPAGVWPDPAELTDGHLTVVDPRTRQEYDLWDVSSKGRDGGRLDFAWGGRTAIDGDGLDSAAVAAGWGSLGGLIRVQELLSGRIDHALAITVPCTNGFVYPARGGGQSCADAGLPGEDAPAMGARLQLALSEAEIEAMQLPRRERAILRALSRYGAFVSDTTGADHWGLEFESPAVFASFGEQDARIALAKRLRTPREDFNGNGDAEYWLPFSSATDWQRDLHVISPCVTRDSC